RGPTAEGADARYGPADAGDQRPARGQPFDPQLGFDGRDGGPDQSEHRRGGGVAAAGDVEDTEHRAGLEVVDRRCGAAPGRDLSDEMLGSEELYRRVQR